MLSNLKCMSNSSNDYFVAVINCSLGKKPPQSVSFKQGLAAPLLCSVSLFGFYSLLRFFPNLDIRTFISAYLGVAGVVAVASNLAPPLRSILPDDGKTSWRIGMDFLISWAVSLELIFVHPLACWADSRIFETLPLTTAFSRKEVLTYKKMACWKYVFDL